MSQTAVRRHSPRQSTLSRSLWAFHAVHSRVFSIRTSL